MKDREIYRTIENLQHQGRQIALATVVDAKGATPRGVGAKMILLADGECLGTIGGGCVEGQVKQAAQEFFRQQQNSQVVEVNLAGEIGQASSDVCGGIMTVMLEKIFNR